MNPDGIIYQTAIDVARETKAADAGVVVTTQGHGTMLRYCIWAIGSTGKVKVTELYAEHTSRDRLKAHAEGFIANHLREFA